MFLFYWSSVLWFALWLFLLITFLYYYFSIWQLFDWMQQNGKISPSSYSSYIKFMGESHNPVGVLEIYNRIEDESTKTNVFVCNSVLGSLVRNGKFDSSMKLFSQMKQNGLKPDVFTYSTVWVIYFWISNIRFLRN